MHAGGLRVSLATASAAAVLAGWQLRGPVRDSRPAQRPFACGRHGWAAIGIPCPECAAGDAPRHCTKHGWSSSVGGCPDCAAGIVAAAAGCCILWFT